MKLPLPPAVLRLCLALLCATAGASVAPAADWYRWRGPTDNGVSPDKNLPAKKTVLWKAEYGCRSTPIVMNGKVYINNSAGKASTSRNG